MSSPFRRMMFDRRPSEILVDVLDAHVVSCVGCHALVKSGVSFAGHLDVHHRPTDRIHFRSPDGEAFITVAEFIRFVRSVSPPSFPDRRHQC